MDLSPSTDRLDLFVERLVKHQRRLSQYVSMLMLDLNDADDVLQETLMVMWRKFDETYPESSFYAWASRTASLVAFRERRSKDRHALALDPEILERIAAEESDDPALSANLTIFLDACMDRLPPQDRELIEQRYQLGMRVACLAKKLGRSAKSVSKSVGRIRRTLLACLQDAVSGQARNDGGRLP
jgi:RNA polymerase sigma-70 factor (ECF subfamily)